MFDSSSAVVEPTGMDIEDILYVPSGSSIKKYPGFTFFTSQGKL